MGDYIDKEKQQDAAGRRRTGGGHFDVEAEHDPERARRVSNAALRRVAEADSKKKSTSDPKALHETASTRTYESVQSGLMLLAKEMHLARTELRDAQKDDPEHNNAVGMGNIEHIIKMLTADAFNLDATFGTADNASTMGPEVKTVWGAWFMCEPEVVRALNWYRAQGGTENLSVTDIDNKVTAMISKLGATPAELPQIRKEPEGDAKAMSETAFADEIAAAVAAVDSLEAGNAADGNRLLAIAQHIRAKGSYSAAFQRHRKEIVALDTRIAALAKKSSADPALKQAASKLQAGLEGK